MTSPNDPSFWYSNAQPWLRKLAERSYYTLPESMQSQFGSEDRSNADARSNVRSATRGARYAQERRINQIRANQGDATPFDPIADKPGDMTADERKYTERLLGEMQGSIPVTVKPSGSRMDDGQNPRNDAITAASVTVPVADVTGVLQDGHNSSPDSISPYRGGSARPTGYSSALSGALGNVADEAGSMRDYLAGRYKADAKRAGTLGNTVQSKNALNADVDAGMVGANAALSNQKQILSDAMSSNWRSNTALNPAPKTALSGMTAATSVAPTPENVKPEDTAASTNTIASGQTSTGLTPQKRATMIQSMRGR